MIDNQDKVWNDFYVRKSLIESISQTYYNNKHQGKRTSFQDTGECVGQLFNMSSRNIGRYLRLSKLVPGLKDLYCSGRISLRAGVELSYLPRNIQEYLVDLLQDDDYKLTIEKVIRLHKLAEKGMLDNETSLRIIQQKQVTTKYTTEKLSRLCNINDLTTEDILRIVYESIEQPTLKNT